WQKGYGAFSYSKSQTDAVVSYVLNQERHHRKKTFKEEYLELLQGFDIKYDEQYLFEFYS
ncbi:MAG: transposase, partial [Bacteroidota bacterium]